MEHYRGRRLFRVDIGAGHVAAVTNEHPRLTEAVEKRGMHSGSAAVSGRSETNKRYPHFRSNHSKWYLFEILRDAWIRSRAHIVLRNVCAIQQTRLNHGDLCG
jgi:hypothetical protein